MPRTTTFPSIPSVADVILSSNNESKEEELSLSSFKEEEDTVTCDIKLKTITEFNIRILHVRICY